MLHLDFLKVLLKLIAAGHGLEQSEALGVGYLDAPQRKDRGLLGHTLLVLFFTKDQSRKANGCSMIVPMEIGETALIRHISGLEMETRTWKIVLKNDATPAVSPGNKSVK